MNPFSPWFAVICLMAALAAAHVVEPWAFRDGEQGRVGVGHFWAGDGVRGVLMLGLYLGHASSWLGLRQTGRWTVPPSVLFTYLTQVAVAMLFMLTGFLYGRKLMVSRGTELNWPRLWLGRLFRLGPVYLVAMVLLCSISWLYGPGVQAGEVMGQVRAYLSWLLFSIPGMPALHGLADTPQVMAGATWTLAYSWIFYALLPWLALGFRVKVRVRDLLWGGGLAGMVIALVPHYSAVYLALGLGLMAAVLSGLGWLARWLQHPLAAVMPLASGAVAAAVSPGTAYSHLALLWLGLAFLVPACGNTLGGVLRWRSVGALGRCGYSFFLLHGPILYVGLDLVARCTGDTLQQPLAFWCAVAALTPLIVLASMSCHRWMEAPAMRWWTRRRSRQVAAPEE